MQERSNIKLFIPDFKEPEPIYSNIKKYLNSLGFFCLEWSIFDSPNFRHQTVSTVQAPLYYTVARYIPFDVYFLIVSIQTESHRSRCFSQLFEIFHYDRINGGFPSSPTPSSSFLFFRKHFNISHARCSRVRYQSIHESQIINIS